MNAVWKKFLNKTIFEANKLLNSLVQIVHQVNVGNDLDPEEDIGKSPTSYSIPSSHPMRESQLLIRENDQSSNQLQQIQQQHSRQHLLLDFSRNRQNYQNLSKEELAQKLFNLTVFKLACIFERVRLYSCDIV